MFGKVSKYFNEKNFGFIQSFDDGNTYFIHASKIQDGYLEKGYVVDFEVFTDKKGKQQAKNVIVIEADND